MKFIILLIRVCLLVAAISILASSSNEAQETRAENQISAFNQL